jgi:hypothetical protein
LSGGEPFLSTSCFGFSCLDPCCSAFIRSFRDGTPKKETWDHSCRSYFKITIWRFQVTNVINEPYPCCR